MISYPDVTSRLIHPGLRRAINKRLTVARILTDEEIDQLLTAAILEGLVSVEDAAYAEAQEALRLQAEHLTLEAAEALLASMLDEAVENIATAELPEVPVAEDDQELDTLLLFGAATTIASVLINLPRWRGLWFASMLDQATEAQQLAHKAIGVRANAAFNNADLPGFRDNFYYPGFNPFAPNIWQKTQDLAFKASNLPASLIDLLVYDVLAYLEEGKKPHEITSTEINRWFKGKEWVANRVSRTVATGAYNASVQQSYVDLGLTSKMWITLADGKVRKTHVALHLKSRPIDKAFSVGGYPGMFPGDPLLPAKEVVNCRCFLHSSELAVAPAP